MFSKGCGARCNFQPRYAGILDRYGEAYLPRHRLSSGQFTVIGAIQACLTDALSDLRQPSRRRNPYSMAWPGPDRGFLAGGR